MEDSLYVQIEDELFGEDWLDSYATTILDAKYEKADILEVVNNQKQLNTAERNDIFRTLKKHESHTPVHALAYPVLCVHLEVFCRELQHLIKLGVLELQGLRRWASPSFVIPKKDSTVR